MEFDIAKHMTVESLCDANGVAAVLEIMHSFCLHQGGDKFSYHFTPIFEEQTSSNTKVFAKGFPNSWVAQYGTRTVRNADPVPRTVMQHGRLMTWGSIRRKVQYSDEARSFIELAQQHGLIYGVGMPLWGPASQNAYAAVGFDDSSMLAERSKHFALHMILQASHQRICELIPADSARPKLSHREREILSWVGKGKSNSVIAEILDISPDTVSTYMRRVFDKLGSRDRVGATIRALKLGLITLDD